MVLIIKHVTLLMMRNLFIILLVCLCRWNKLTAFDTLTSWETEKESQLIYCTYIHILMLFMNRKAMETGIESDISYDVH